MGMTALEIANSVFRREVGRELETLFGDDTDSLVLKEAVRAGIVRAATEFEWRQLHATGEIEGDGATAEFALPSNFRALVTGGELREVDSRYALRFVPTRQEWLNLYDLPAGAGERWTWSGDNIAIDPAPGDGVEIEFAYITKDYWACGGGTYAEFPSSDNSECVLPSVVCLAVVSLTWREFQGMKTDVAEARYQSALAKAIRDNSGGPALVRRSEEDAAYEHDFTIDA